MATICKLDSENCLDIAERVILDGGVVVYPTDTLYGFGVDARNVSTLERLSQIKGRGGPWSIIVSSQEMAEIYGQISEDKRAFVDAHVPGKVTLIVKARKTEVSSRVLGPGGTVGFRIPDHSFPIQLTKRLNFPITSTSVNRTGKPPMNDPAAIEKHFGNEVQLIVDGGRLPSTRGSAVYDLSGKDIRVIRYSS